MLPHCKIGIEDVVIKVVLQPKPVANNKLKHKEAGRLLRSVESLTRQAISLLQSVMYSPMTTKPNDSSDVVIENPRRSDDQSQWRRRRIKSAQTGVPANEVLALTDVTNDTH